MSRLRHPTMQGLIKATSPILYLCIFSSDQDHKEPFHSFTFSDWAWAKHPSSICSSGQDFPMVSKADQNPLYFPDQV